MHIYIYIYIKVSCVFGADPIFSYAVRQMIILYYSTLYYSITEYIIL